MQDLPVILKRDNLQNIDKTLDFYIALKSCTSDFYFLNRRKKCKVATYNIVSVYMRILRIDKIPTKSAAFCIRFQFFTYIQSFITWFKQVTDKFHMFYS